MKLFNIFNIFTKKTKTKSKTKTNSKLKTKTNSKLKTKTKTKTKNTNNTNNTHNGKTKKELCSKYKDKSIRGTPKNWAYNKCLKNSWERCKTLPPAGWNMYRDFCD